MANRALLSLASGLGRGYMTEEDRKTDIQRRDRLDAQNTELHQARMDEINAGKQQRMALADAAAPAKVDTGYQVTDDRGSAAFTKDPDAAAAMQDMAGAKGAAPTLANATRVNKKTYADPKEASKEAEEYNSTDAVTKRQIKALQTTDPAKAITLANAAIEQKQKIQSEADKVMYRRINEFQTPEDMADFMTTYPHDGMGGKFKASIVRSPDDKSWSFVGTDAEGKQIKIPGEYTNDEDGMVRARETLAGRFGDPNRRLEFYKWDQEMSRKKGATAETARHNAVMEDAAIRNAKANETRAGNATGGGNLNREERIRYTTLFNDAGRRLGESKKTLAMLQKSALFMTQARTEGSPQAQQLQELQDSIKGYEEERSTYQGLLAGSQTPEGKGGSAPAAPKPTAAGQPAQPTSQAEYDAIPKGSKYMRDGKVFVKN